MSDVVPFEVQMEIVKRVDDVSSLIRFRSVSKEWKSFIDSRDFIADNDDGFALQHDFPPFVVVPDLIQQLKRDKIVVGMSRGLFCMHGFDINSGRGTIVIWNPLIRKSVGILVPDHVPHTFDFDNYGFGFVPLLGKLNFFTLSSKRWNLIIPSSNMPRKSIRLDSHNQGNKFPFPDSLVNEVYRFLTISKLRDLLLCLTQFIWSTGIILWCMDDGNVASFKKMFNFDMIDTSVDKILGFMKRGEPVLESYQELEESDLSVLEAYEPWSEHMTNLGIYGVNGSFFMDSYVETLLLLDHLMD
ncbi:F-box/kelch-repeat protein-like protein [Tanacetum coccineum]